MTMKKEKLVEKIEIRVSRQEKNIIKTLAMMYADGNISAYVIDRVLYSNRKLIDSGDFELSNRRIKAAPEDAASDQLESID